MTQLVTIGIPVYNGARFLTECLDSVMNQTYPFLEILIVDDGSTDESLEIVKKYQRKFESIRLVQNEDNLGLVGNWNKCLSLAKGHWIKLHFQDDLMKPETVERMVQMSIDNNLSLVLTDREFFYEDGLKNHFVGLKRLSDFFDKPTIIELDIFTEILINYGIRDNFIGEPIIGLMKKNLLVKHGIYDDQFKQIVDFEYWLRIALNERIGYIPDRLHQFRIHHSSQGSKNIRHRGGRFSIPDLDKMNLTHKLMTDDSFENFRKKAPENYLDKLIKNHITEKAVRIGSGFIKKEMEPHLAAYIYRSRKAKIRAEINEVIHIIGLKFRI